jgi:hypothetical protein
MAPAAIADKSSSLNNWVADSIGSTIAEILLTSRTTSEGVASSRAFAVGRIVTTSSKAAVAPQIVTDFFELFG